jgi:DNA-binding MarR family transcriptional regulator
MSVPRDRRATSVPRREDWPQPPGHTTAGKLLTELVIAAFRLNGRLLETAQQLAAHGELTAAWWQVLGGVVDQPRAVAEIARRMGMTRQGVQRVADLLVARDLAEYRPNPSHRRAKLLACTEAGHWAIRQIALSQHPWANEIGATVGAEQLHDTLTTMQRLIAALETNLARDERLAANQTKEHPGPPPRPARRNKAHTAPTRTQRSHADP